jgi:deoxyribonuclease V
VQWPTTAAELVRAQEALAAVQPTPFGLSDEPLTLGGCFVCFERGVSGPGENGDRGWAGASLWSEGRAVDTVVVDGPAGAPYAAGFLAFREGALLEAAVRALPRLPDVLLVNATGRDHPRRAGLAVHLGAVLDVPTVGVTHRLLLATGEWPADQEGAMAPLHLGEELVGYWVRTRERARPLAVHAAWRTDAQTAAEVVLRAMGKGRTPGPLACARRAARTGRASAA